ncbi:SGNH/GDSL hydrolase family protein [Gloeocapsopsis dulcis]|uniref:Lysophospholipase n=1 Tax=Gloeocapsopsis dulcis AAB1 = 1H9 TaxID=1433147 RepID=A0A6N8FZG3_9CHRO|nr:SGNH/GDSL hydrolase family protein [Gloeocapsopsis dulcis]MUL37286.1 lysophospholipase [Gloeocapsopsis dulcis AAB1 = 1H9]WNN91090.1 SGNH/GDSL hydrolase family protein [Gloeocapsopsis dulcis]
MKFSTTYWIPSIAIIALTATEIALRLAFGLGNPVLSQADADTGYRFQPNQKLSRFGKTIEYNQYSQRSEPITLEKPQGTLRILMIGDSVLNGGNPTDQSQILSELFKAKLSTSQDSTQVLNASAGSWGIGNQLGYLRKFGTFQADAVILQIGTHDLIQPKSTSERVGRDPNYPNQAPLLAIQELVSRYALPKTTRLLKLNSSSTEIPEVASNQQKLQFEQNMESFKNIVNRLRTENIPVFVLYTPNRADLLPNFNSPPYKSEFFQLLKSLEIPVIDTHTNWSNLPPATVVTYFRDQVHLSVAGNQAAAELLFQQLCMKRQSTACSQNLARFSALKP